MKNNKIIIAIDGHSSCGKSTFAKAIAARLGYIFIDTGAMYRAVTLYALEHGAIKSCITDEDMIESMLDDIKPCTPFFDRRQQGARCDEVQGARNEPHAHRT